MAKIEIISDVDVKHIVSAVFHQMEDKEKVRLAIDFGDNGDLSYELLLLQELTKLIPKVYPLKDMQKDDDLYPIVQSLLKLRKELKFLDNE